MEYFKKYADCFFIRGESRGVLYDLSRKKYQLIPLSMIDFMEEIDMAPTKVIETMKKTVDPESVDEYLSFLMGNEFVFKCDQDELSLFSPIDLTFKYPSVFSNAIFICDDLKKLDWNLVINNLSSVNCSHLQLYYFQDKKLNRQKLDLFLKLFENSRMKSIELYISYNESLENVDWKKFCESNKRLKSLIISNSKEFKQETYGKYGMGNILYIPISVSFDTVDSMIHPYYFNANIDLFCENQKFNSFFNKKLFIDEKGEIKISFCSSESFGNIEHSDLRELGGNNDYKVFWEVSKNKIKECQNCEFRYMCVDNRLPIKDKDGQWRFERPCNYKPKTMSWDFK